MAWFTVKVKVVLRVTPPDVPVTVIVEFPVVAELLAVRVSVEEQVGLQEVGEKDALTPEGRPEALKLTDCALPADKVAVTELVTELPCDTVLAPPLLIEKSNED